jgi:hypothetical protein
MTAQSPDVVQEETGLSLYYGPNNQKQYRCHKHKCAMFHITFKLRKWKKFSFSEKIKVPFQFISHVL